MANETSGDTEQLILKNDNELVEYSAVSISSSSSMERRVSAIEKLNPMLPFEESERPDDLDEDWAFVSKKNIQKRVYHATSDLDTFVLLLKGNIGTGLLALPYATKEAGYILGPLGLLCLGLIATHCIVLLLESANTLCKKNGIQTLDYAETMQFAMRDRGAHKIVHKISKVTVNTFLIITQFGFCSVYFVFIGKSLQQVMSQTYCIDWSIKAWIAIIILPIILFSWIRNLDNLAPLSTLANICILVGLAVILYDEIYRLVTNGSSAAAVETGTVDSYGTIQPLALFFGTAIFSFEGIGVVLPLENKMKIPAHAKRVVYTGMLTVTILYSAFGLIGYLVYGDDIQPSITLNLCGRDAGTAIVFLITKLLFVCSIFVSFLLQFYVPMDFLEPQIVRMNYLVYKYPLRHEAIKTAIQLTFRTILVLVTASLALSIPDLDDLITLIGAVASSALALIFPPTIELLTFWRDPNRRWLRVLPRPFWIIKDFAIISLGIIGFLFGAFASFYNIVGYFEKKAASGDICGDDVFQTVCHLV